MLVIKKGHFAIMQNDLFYVQGRIWKLTATQHAPRTTSRERRIFPARLYKRNMGKIDC